MLTKLSVKKPYSVIVAVAIIMILGIIALLNIHTDLLPDVDYPYAVVVTEYADAAPEEVEANVTKPIEKSLAGVNHIKSIDSVSTEGKSIVTVEFTQSADMDSVVAEMRECFEPLKNEWGEGVDTPYIRKINPDSMPVMVASVDIEGKDAAETSEFVSDTLMGYFEGIDGVADLASVGLVSKQIQITINPDKLAEVNKTIYDAIDGDYAKTRAALEATDTDLNSATSQLSSDLLAQTAAIDKQLRSLNAQLAKAQAAQGVSEDRKGDLEDEVADLQAQKDALNQKDTLTEEEEAQLEEIQSDLETAKANLRKAESGSSSENSTITSLENQISTLESQRNALTSQMSRSESDVAKSKASITDQLNALNTAEENAKAESDLQTLITLDMVSSMLSAQNFSSTAGSLALGNKEYSVKVGDKINSVEELQNLILFHFNIEGVEDVLLSNVADVAMVNDSADIYAKINNHDGVLISFMKQSDFSTAEVADSIWAAFDKVTEKYPTVTITPLSDQSVYIDRVSHAVEENLILGAVLAILVLLLFLRDIRPTLVVAIAIPVSLLFALVLMYFTGVTLNIFSLSGLALGVGMLVDNSIVVMENIYRCRSIGLSRRDAAIEGTKQVSGAIIASTLTTICVFLPVIFTNGLSRELFTDIGLTIAYALIASLMIAFTLVPAMSASVLRTADRRRAMMQQRILDKYEALLRWVLSHRIFVMVFIVLLLVFSSIFALSRGTSFLPESDSTEMTLSVTMQEETKTEVLWQTTDTIVSLLQEMEDVESVGAVQDSGGTISTSGVSEGDSTTVYIVLKDDKKHSCGEIADQIAEETQNLKCNIDFSIGSYDLSSLYDEGIRIVVNGDDLKTLAKVTEDMGDILLSVEGIQNVKDTMDTATPALKVTVDKAAAMKYGLTVAEVYDFISESISNSANATTLSQSGTDVIVLDGTAGNLSLADIQNLTMEVTDDEGVVSKVVIGSIAAISEEEGAPVIYRNDQARYMTAKAEIADGYNVGLISEEVKELVSGYDLPDGYTVSVEGEKAVISDSMKELVLILGLALLLMYLIMVAQFQSLLLPLIIMITIPLAFTGGFLALLISGKDLSIIAIVGFLVLAGIVVNNGIVLIDYVNRLRKSGKPLSASLIEGGRTRLRPILMTAATTILAILTLAFGLGLGAEVVQPMAIVVLGGMIYATFMTLFAVPAMYDLLLRRKADNVAEFGLEYRSNDKDERTEFYMEKRTSDQKDDQEDDDEDGEDAAAGFFTRLKEKFSRNGETEDEIDEEEDGEEDEGDEEESSFRSFFHRHHGKKDKEEETAEEDETDLEEDQKESGLTNFLYRHDREDFEDDEDDEDEDDEDDDDEEETPRFRLFRRLRRNEDEYEEDEDDEEEEEDEEEDEEPSGFFRRIFHRREEIEEDDDEDDDEDYYGLRDRSRQHEEKEKDQLPKNEK